MRSFCGGRADSHGGRETFTIWDKSLATLPDSEIESEVEKVLVSDKVSRCALLETPVTSDKGGKDLIVVPDSEIESGVEQVLVSDKISRRAFLEALVASDKGGKDFIVVVLVCLPNIIEDTDGLQ